LEHITAEPNAEGLDVLQQELYEKITQFSLIDNEGNEYYKNSIHSSFFDTDGVLTVIVQIPKDEHFTVWNAELRVLSDDNKIITKVETPAIQFVKGVGGTQTVKIAVSGKANSIIYKADDYITIAELEGMYMGAIQALTAKVFRLENILIKKGIIDV